MKIPLIYAWLSGASFICGLMGAVHGDAFCVVNFLCAVWLIYTAWEKSK